MATKKKRRTAAEIIAIHFSIDINDVREHRYQPTRYVAPILFTLDEFYYCWPVNGQKPPEPWKWEKIAEYCGRQLLRAHMNSGEDQ